MSVSFIVCVVFDCGVVRTVMHDYPCSLFIVLWLYPSVNCLCLSLCLTLICV